jgi:sugar phosphate permease
VPALNVVLLVFSIISSNCAASMLFSRYCPSLADTGMVSTATGFLDFVSYMSASASSTLFANSVNTIGWNNLILIWVALMLVGVAISVPAVSKQIIEKRP